MIKKFFLFTLLASAFCVACSDDDDKDDVSGGTFTVTKDSLSFGSEGGTDKFSLQTDNSWSIDCPDWITCDPSSGEKTTVSITVTCEANESAESRQGVITITCGNASKEIAVTQDNSIYLSVDVESIKIDDYTGGSATVEINYGGEELEITASDWIDWSVNSNGNLDLSVGETIYVRTGTITIKCGDKEVTITIRQSGDPSVAGIRGDSVEDIMLAMGMGWNLGNQMDAYEGTTPDETCWKNGECTQATMDAVVAAGFRTVRIPVTWLDKVTKNSDGTYSIDDTWLNRVAEIVGYCENAGLNAIVNIHHDGAADKYEDGPHFWLNIKAAAADATKNAEIEEQIEAMWTIIAEKFKDKGDFLMFEGFNEIHDGGWGWSGASDLATQRKILNEWNQIFVNSVRATGSNNTDRWLGCPSYVANPSFAVSYWEMPTDPANHIMVAVHDYDPNDLCLYGTSKSWGHNSSYTSTWGFKESDLTDTFKSLYDKFIVNEIPVYFGEMGCVKLSTDASVEAWRLYYLEYFVKAAKTYGLAPIYWDNGGTGTGENEFGIINHSTGAFLSDGEDVANAMTNAMNNDDEDYTLDSVYNNSPK